MGYNYKMVKVVCKGNIKNCVRCGDNPFEEGYCPQCGRPLWLKPGDPCRHVVAYVERTNEQQKQGNSINFGKKVNIICTRCNTVTTI